jgi:hypothetical protein
MRQSQNFVKKEFVPVIQETQRKQRVQSARLSQPKFYTPKYSDLLSE